MNLGKNINYYLMAKTCEKLQTWEIITEQECSEMKKRLVEICQPDPEYIR